MFSQTSRPSDKNGGIPVECGPESKSRLPAPSFVVIEQLKSFLSTMFAPDDLVELRFIDTWTTSSGKQSRFRGRTWSRADVVPDDMLRLQKLNSQGANILYGVNPRRINGGTKEAVSCCRSVWMDMDNVTYAEAMERLEGQVPRPSVVFSSGTGIHAYWLLEQPYHLTDPTAVKRFEQMLKALYTQLGCDSVQDVSRMLRLPGFDNCKEFANGAQPQNTLLFDCVEDRRYPLDAFAPWWPRDKTDAIVKRVVPSPSRMPKVVPAELSDLVKRLDQPTRDRSRRDFAIVLELLRSGASVESIWHLVEGRSKFATAGQAYFDTTIENAIKELKRTSHSTRSNE